MKTTLHIAGILLIIVAVCCASPWTPENAAWNVNLNPDGSDPSRYYGDWPGHSYFPSPGDWRQIPIYQFITDRLADGDPANNELDYGGYDLFKVDSRHGGDFKGIQNRLPYIKSLGYKAIWISPMFQNMFNSYHGYGQMDFTLIEKRFGTLEDFRSMVDRAHDLGMYVVVDIVVNHLGDLYYFEGYPGGGAPFAFHIGEYKLIEKTPGVNYPDFKVDNTYYPDGQYPEVYNDSGERVDDNYGFGGSYWESDFHHNGDLGSYSDPWQNHLGKIYGSLDDLRTTHPRVQDKIIAMTKSLISSTDVDGIRMDTPMQVPLGFFKRWCPAVKQHAASLGKDNFFIFGEFYCDRGRAATMVGRGNEPEMWGNPFWFISDEFSMDGGINYRMYYDFFMPAVKEQANGSLHVIRDSYYLDWLAFDFYHPAKAENRYRQLNFYNNHDQWRMATSSDGFRKTDLGSAIVAFWPGIPLFYYGDEQGFCTYGSGIGGDAREDMMTSLAWENAAAPVSPNPANKDNFDMLNPHFQYVQKCMNVRSQYPALFNTDTIYERWVEQSGNNGIYAYSRAWGPMEEWALVMFNTWSGWLPAGGSLGDLYTGWQEGDVIVNAMNPSETRVVESGGNIGEIWVAPYETKVFVHASHHKPLMPVVNMAFPAHDERIGNEPYVIQLSFSEPMDRDSVKSAFRFDGAQVDSAGLDWKAAENKLLYLVDPTDGIHTIEVLETATSTAGKRLFGAYRSRFRKGSDQNIICNPSATWDDSLINGGAATLETNVITLTHKAVGAEMFRVANDGDAWSDWQAYTNVSEWTVGGGADPKTVTVQYWADGSAAYFVSDSIDSGDTGVVSWVGNTWHYPFDGDIDAQDDFWVNVESDPSGAAVSAFVSYRVDGGDWISHEMSWAEEKDGHDWWHVNLGTFAPGSQIEYSVLVQDGAGDDHWDNNDGVNYTAEVNVGDPVYWVGNSYHWPLRGDIDPGEDVWVNIESYPIGTAVSAMVVYSIDGGGNWRSAEMSIGGQHGANDWWHVNLGSFDTGIHIRYAILVRDGLGADHWDSNGGGDYHADVN
ncbi:MAG: hypothetical protein KJ626_04350 [Verrucomicrobia bacterium]|nr:hypothetical protein [Verrucomicrobiota bacterium]